MKKVLLAIFLCLFIFSCKEQELRSDFDVSIAAWKNFRETSNNSYEYMTASSSWVGTSSTTVITVRYGEVIKRQYTQYQLGTAGNTPVKTWTETRTDLNSHPEGSRGITLDEVYEQARNWVKASEKENTIYFETNNAGMISLCGYVPDNCADDCFTGITITGIKAL